MIRSESIDRIEALDTGVRLFSENAPLELTWFWIQDHSEDPESFDPVTKQRTIDSFNLDRNPEAGTPTLHHDGLRVEWPTDTPKSFVSTETLLLLASAGSAPSRQLWRSADEISITYVPHEDVMTTNDGLRRWLSDVDRFGFGMLNGTPGTQEAAEALMNRVGYVRRTVFGDTWTLSSEVQKHADSAYGAETLEPHTDGCYSHDGPGMQMFSCSERTGEGGESVLVDGFAAAEALRQSEPDAFRLLTEVAVPAHYIEEGVHLQAQRPTIRLDENGHLLQITFNNYDRSPFVLPEPRMSKWYDAYSAFHALLVDESSWWKHYLVPGETLLFDNWRCLHGRMAYNGRRVFNGGYINHEDLESRIRVLAKSE